MGLGATFNEDLVYRIGTAISDEARALNNQGFDQFLSCWAPNMNLATDPRWYSTVALALHHTTLSLHTVHN